MTTKPPSTGKRIGAVGIGGAVLGIAAALVAKWEGVRYPVYPDPATGGAPYTVCYGHTGPEVKLGQTYTKEQCGILLEHDLAIAQAIVRKCIKAPMLEHQEASLISATFNIGPRIVCGSTLQAMANAGNWVGACAQLSRWNKAAGRVMRGLTLRRMDERAVCEGRGAP
ncbi:lysozyme [Arenimonas sp.]|uniref:lysozyme n=1 Tax=Arenimonas sp. TaxID=1872635 RepID=UPI0039E52019